MAGQWMQYFCCKVKRMMNKTESCAVLIILFLFTHANFIMNCVQYKNQYVQQMFMPVKLLTLSEWSYAGYLLMLIYPVLVILPSMSEPMEDRESGELYYLGSRINRWTYYSGNLCAVFFCTFLIFTIPFLTEFIMSIICFPREAAGDPSNIDYIRMFGTENQYFLTCVYQFSPQMYAVICTLLFGMVSGIIAVSNTVFGSAIKIRQRILGFLPVYLILLMASWMDRFLSLPFSLNYMNYRMFSASAQGMWKVCIPAVCVWFLGLIAFMKRKRKEDIL